MLLILILLFLLLNFGIQDGKADGDKNESIISDAVIAEMEASIYGLQVFTDSLLLYVTKY